MFYNIFYVLPSFLPFFSNVTKPNQKRGEFFKYSDKQRISIRNIGEFKLKIWVNFHSKYRLVCQSEIFIETLYIMAAKNQSLIISPPFPVLERNDHIRL